MARMSLDDSVLREPRITLLAQMLGWSRRETLGCLIEIWAICYDRIDASLGPKVIDLISKHEGFADLMLEVELATLMPSGKLRIAGAKERISYLNNLKQWGREGGIKSAESKARNVKGSTKPPVKPPHNPSAPDLPSASASPPDLVLEDQTSANADACAPSGSAEPAPDPPSEPRGKRKSEPTEQQLQVVERVLDRLSARNGTKYRQRGIAHAPLILARLSEGRTELELRAVIAYCAEKLGWQGDPRMQDYLRPQTLFGPETINRYADPAMTWAEQTYPDEFSAASAGPLWVAGGAK